jgi:hypothetical protein
MAQANTHNITLASSRRRFLTVAAASAVSVTALAAAAMPVHQEPLDDSALLKLEKLVFEQNAAARAYDDEMFRLQDIWMTESKQLHVESLTGRCDLTQQERWDRVSAMPEAKEHERLVGLQRVHDTEMDRLVSEMWATPAHTPEGRRSKLLVLLGCILTDDWRKIPSGRW